MKDDEAIVY